MTTTEFDYDAFFNNLESVDTLSNNTTSPTTSTENESDSGIASTPSMSNHLDNTVIDLDDLDIFPLNMDNSLLEDPNNEFKNFSAMLDETNQLMTGNHSTFENLFSDFDLSVQQNSEISQEIPSPKLPILLPKSNDIPTITNCIKIQPYTTTKSIKLEPITSNSHIKIIKTSKPVTVTNIPVITMPLTPNNSLNTEINTIKSPSIKRRRTESPTNDKQLSTTSILTLEQLKLQYSNMSEEALKKHLRMIKNRESAAFSRKRRKELMENLDIKVKELTNENEQLKKENSKLLTRIHTLELENELLKKYKTNPQPRKPLILMGLVLLVVFNIFTIKSFIPVSNNPSDLIPLYNNQRAVVPGRTILSNRQTNNQDLYITNNENDNPSTIPSYPYLQCVAYINKTHSQRINQDLRSWVQDKTDSITISDSKSLTIPSEHVIQTESDSSIEPLHHISRKVARKTKIQSTSNGQLQPYKIYEANYEDFIHTLDRKNDTLYFISFKRDHLILPATVQNQTQRPKMSLILPASMANLNKSIHVPVNHVPMIKIDCEVEDTKLVFVKRSHIPLSYQNDLFQYYSTASQSSI